MQVQFLFLNMVTMGIGKSERHNWIFLASFAENVKRDFVGIGRRKEPEIPEQCHCHHDQVLEVWLSLTDILGKALAPHSSILAWKIPWTEEPGKLQSMGSLRVGHDWATSLSLFTFMHWRRKWQPTPVFLPGGSQGRESLVGCRLWGCTESDMTEAT